MAVAALGVVPLALTPHTSAAFADPGRVESRFGSTAAAELDFIGVDAGEAFSLGWTSDGRLYSWGANDRGQLGLGDMTLRTTPTQVFFPAEVEVASAAAGINTSIARTVNGEVYTWGNPDVAGNTSTPRRVEALLSENIVGVSSGGYYYLAWTAEGRLYSWGESAGGRLGRTGEAQVPGLVTAQGANTQQVSSAAAGRFFGTATLNGGLGVIAWGQNFGGAGGATATGLPIDSPVTGLSAGNAFTFAWTSDGRLYSRTTTSSFTRAPTVAPVIGAEVTIPATGASSFFVWDQAGDLYSWGLNSSGQLGLGDTVDRPTPTLATLPGDAEPLRVAAGAAHALVTAGGGAFSSAGANSSGQLGTDDTAGRDTFSTPVLIQRWP